MKETQEKPLDQLQDHEIDIKQYVYDANDKVEIPAKMVEGLIEILGQVQTNETTYGFIGQYPESSKEIKDENGKVIKVEVKWNSHQSAESYFNQETPLETTSMLGVMALDLLMLLKQVHLSNIRSGKAQKIGTIKPPKQNVKLS